MCNKIVKSTSKTAQLDKNTLKSLIQQYCNKRVRMQQLISKIKRSRRQITRMVRSYRTTGEISTTRGYGSHLPYNQKETAKVFKLLWSSTNDKIVAHIMEIPIKRLKRHKKIISLPQSNFCLDWDENRENCTFIIHIETYYLINSVLRISITVNVKLVKIIERKIDVVEKNNISFVHCNCEHYNQFVNWFIEAISESYFQQLKMRTMEKRTELERIKAFKSYYYSIINNMESSDLLLNILPIINHYDLNNNIILEVEENERKISSLNVIN